MKLQGRSIDVAHAYQDISMAKAALQELDVVLIRFMKLFIRMQLHWLTVLKLKSLVLELQATNSIGQIHLQLMLASITDEHQLFQS